MATILGAARQSIGVTSTPATSRPCSPVSSESGLLKRRKNIDCYSPGLQIAEDSTTDDVIFEAVECVPVQASGQLDEHIGLFEPSLGFAAEGLLNTSRLLGTNPLTVTCVVQTR